MSPLILLAQLPIPPAGVQAVAGNVPLAAGYLKLFARKRGLESAFGIEILPSRLANALGDRGLVEAILARQPWMVGFTCYLWNIDRTLWVAAQLKARRPELKIVLGGPEITVDNAWVQEHPAVDYAVFGEGEQTFAELLQVLRDGGDITNVPGLWSAQHRQAPRPRTSMVQLDEISSPYLEGILDAADDRMLLLETARGCVFKCRFCYYPKSYDGLYFLSEEKVLANLQHADQRGATEVFLLDPTLNQRRDFDGFVRLLARGNPRRQFTYSAELRAEGITDETARLLAEANFTEVEIGLQSVDRHTQELMSRRVNQKAFLRGAQAMLEAGIRVRIDLIVGLPGDTVESVRRGIDLLAGLRPQCQPQIFNLAVLPGTSFRQDAQRLGLTYNPRPPYYVLGTPTLSLEDMAMLVDEAQEAFQTEFDPLPPPLLDWPDRADLPQQGCRLDLDDPSHTLPPPQRRAQAFVLWLQSSNFPAHQDRAIKLITQVLDDNPHTTLDVILEPTAKAEQISPELLDQLLSACYRTTSYLDRYYSLHLGRARGAKRLAVLLSAADRPRLGLEWVDELGQYATLIWQHGEIPEEELAAHEYVL